MVLLNECLFGISKFFLFILLPPLTPSPSSVPDGRGDPLLEGMAQIMKLKYDKYWGSVVIG